MPETYDIVNGFVKDMSTEKEIRRFMKANMPRVEDGGRFMEELSRQIDLLPQPAQASKQTADRQEAIGKILDTASRLKRNILAGAVSAAIVAAILIAALLLLYLFSPGIRQTVSGHLEYFMAGYSLAVLGAALLSLRDERI